MGRLVKYRLHVLTAASDHAELLITKESHRDNHIELKTHDISYKLTKEDVVNLIEALEEFDSQLSY